MMRAKLGTMRRRAITVSATDTYLEVRLDSVLELLRFTGIAVAAIRMGLGGAEGQDEAVGSDTGQDMDTGADEGFDRDIYLSYRSIRLQVA